MLTVDTNVAVYAVSPDSKGERARALLSSAHFLSVQVCNEFVLVSRRKLKRQWPEILHYLRVLQNAVPDIRAIDRGANAEAIRIAERYELNFYDALLVAVALANGATTFYSEDMQHGLLVDGVLRIVNPFIQDEA